MHEVIDIVYLLVEGIIPEFRARRNKVLGRIKDFTDLNREGRIAETKN